MFKASKPENANFLSIDIYSFSIVVAISSIVRFQKHLLKLKSYNYLQIVLYIFKIIT